jgi:hypothetical protein
MNLNSDSFLVAAAAMIEAAVGWTPGPAVDGKEIVHAER